MANHICDFRNGFQTDSEEVKNGNENLTYCEYLNLDTLLSVQNLLSVEYHQPAHHEHLFIVIHQVYELWFKQIIFELDSLKIKFRDIEIETENQYEAVKRLHRIVQILKLLIEQFAILGTMTSSDFMEFRHFLCSASGFQSLQFRLIENKLGLTQEDRVQFQKDLSTKFCSNEKKYSALKESETEPSLLLILQRWLENWPWKKINYEQFMNSYKAGVENFLNQKVSVKEDYHINDEDNLALKRKRILYDSLFDSKMYSDLIKQKERKLSQKAMLGAIAIALYHHEPEVCTSYQIINLVVDIDLYLMKWRYNHALLVQKMIGSSNVGSGGSSGYQYLRSTLGDQYKVFNDLENIATFLIPRKFIPPFATVKMK